jgi:hypothetical protein
MSGMKGTVDVCGEYGKASWSVNGREMALRGSGRSCWEPTPLYGWFGLCDSMFAVFMGHAMAAH